MASSCNSSPNFASYSNSNQRLAKSNCNTIIRYIIRHFVYLYLAYLTHLLVSFVYFELLQQFAFLSMRMILILVLDDKLFYRISDPSRRHRSTVLFFISSRNEIKLF